MNKKVLILVGLGFLFLFVGINLIMWNTALRQNAEPFETLYAFHELIGIIGVVFGSYIMFLSGELNERNYKKPKRPKRPLGWLGVISIIICSISIGVLASNTYFANAMTYSYIGFILGIIFVVVIGKWSGFIK
jgi:hypothetical protein